ncbi:ABC transporter ATP-binding protein [Paenalkalicoccus suaedae]|uniref:ABC transporter ATP-binding protein n=1 Tax=Paenalkalicoccus suaedae TaxID=2592382 RepID=A0A859FAV7_9BACI|nr:ABC transporter ATP-binding protein [Paenalkalicoccus suaedae]QKS69918.1 ABC transporter ATP-binding protein [Paenalkalicoccus suaedae]
MIIDVKNVHKTYKKQPVLKGVDMQIEEPAILALVGPNGAGKTTLLHCMTNLLPIDQGSIHLLGKNHANPEIFYETAYMQDNRVLYDHLTGYDHLRFITQVQKMDAARIHEVTEQVGMSSYVKKRVRAYSLGMKQHLLLAMALINKPKLLLMDEPLNGLDPTSALRVRHILQEIAEAGTTVVLSSHILGEIDRLTDTIYFMKDGVLLKESADQFAINEYAIYVDQPHAAKSALEEMEHVRVKDGVIHFDESTVALARVLDTVSQQGLTITRIENERIGAEKRYRELFET